MSRIVALGVNVKGGPQPRLNILYWVTGAFENPTHAELGIREP